MISASCVFNTVGLWLRCVQLSVQENNFWMQIYICTCNLILVVQFYWMLCYVLCSNNSELKPQHGCATRCRQHSLIQSLYSVFIISIICPKTTVLILCIGKPFLVTSLVHWILPLLYHFTDILNGFNITVQQNAIASVYEN